MSFKGLSNYVIAICMGCEFLSIMRDSVGITSLPPPPLDQKADENLVISSAFSCPQQKYCSNRPPHSQPPNQQATSTNSMLPRCAMIPLSWSLHLIVLLRGIHTCEKCHTTIKSMLKEPPDSKDNSWATMSRHFNQFWITLRTFPPS